MIKNIYTYMYLISFLLPLKSINVSGCTSIKKSLKFEVWIYFFEERLLKVAFIQKELMRLSFLQTDEPNYFPELEF